MKSSLVSIQKQIETEELQLKTLVSEKNDAETDPKLLLSRQGVPVVEGYSFAYVGQSVVIFPNTQEAETKLINSGYRRQELTPVIYGYVPGIRVRNSRAPSGRHMAKAEKPKSKPKPKFTDKVQSERFIEAARKLGIEETGEAFERAFKKVVPPAYRDKG